MRGFSISRTKKQIAPPRVRMAEITSTSLECSDRRAKRRWFRCRSNSTENPMPPTVISAQMMSCTTGSFL